MGTGTHAMLRRDERGQAMLESALVFPVLVLLLLGILQLGLWYHAEFVVRTACQEGARVASAENGTLAEGLQRTRALLIAGLGRTGARVTVQGRVDDARATVSARGALPTLLPWIDANQLPLRAQASMVRERFRPGTSGP
jgi:Flp pilus assembly protein TadG